MILLVGVITLLILLALGAFFSATETVLMAFSHVDIRILKEESAGQKTKIAKIEKLLESPEKLLASLLIGNNIANISASAIVAYLTNLYLGSIFIVLTTVILTLIIVYFSEIVPKHFALFYKRKIALATVWPVTFFYKLFAPMLTHTMWLNRKIFPKLRARQEKENFVRSLQHTADLAFEQGDIDKYKRDFIDNVLELNAKTAKQIMTHRQDIFSVAASARLQDIYPEIIKNSYSRIPVYKNENENIIGVLYLKDVQKLSLSPGQNSPSLDGSSLEARFDFATVTVAQLLKKVDFKPSDISVTYLYSYFKNNRGHLVIILDEYGGLAGVVSQEDVLEAVFGQLDNDRELQLSIFREGDAEKKKDDDTYIFSGMLSIQQFEEYFNIEIKMEKNANLVTMSGYICAHAIPEKGQKISLPEGIFQVLESDGKKMISLRLEPSEFVKQKMREITTKRVQP